MILLDTNVLIDPPESWSDDRLGASVIALGELHFGIQAASDTVTRSGRVQGLAFWRSRLQWLPFDERAADSYGILAAEVSKTRPSHARSKDILMAAHAHSLGIPLMTRNAKDFQLVSHLVEMREIG